MQVYSGKIPIRIHPFFWLLIFLIGWVNTFTVLGTLVWAVVIFFSVLIHELGHALTAVGFGQQAEIELFGLGGVTQRRGAPLKLWEEFLIVMNGPLAGLALCFLAYQIRRMIGDQPMNIFIYSLNITIYVNAFWTVVNLLPIHPLDGGHLFRIVLEGIFGFRGVKISLFISLLLSAVISLVFFGLGALLIGALFFLLTFENYRQWKGTLALTELDRDAGLQQSYREAETELVSGRLENAYQRFEAISRQTKQGMLFLSAREEMAKILGEWGRHQEAYDLLYPYRKKLSVDSFRYLHHLAYRIGNWDEAITLGNRAFQYEPNYETALINALCYAILGQAKPAIGWLQTAMNEGLPNLSSVLTKKEFDHIRDTPQFQHLLEQSSNESS